MPFQRVSEERGFQQNIYSFMLTVFGASGTTETIERAEFGVETSTDADVIEELWEVPGVGRIPGRREPEEDASSPLLSSARPSPN